MNQIIDVLQRTPGVSDYKINLSAKESLELFFVKGKLETMRRTDTCDRQVTVYADHDGKRGDSSFHVYPGTTDEALCKLAEDAVQSALLISNPPYSLPEKETETFKIPSNLQDMDAMAEAIAQTVFRGNTVSGGSINSLEIFISHYREQVLNSRGLSKEQDRYDAMVEAIPTFTDDHQSVELYHQYCFSNLDQEELIRQIQEKMDEVSARCKAVTPALPETCPVVFNRLELADLFGSISRDLNYATVYGHGNRFHKGDWIQTECQKDSITLSMKGSIEGNCRSSCFDSDGLSLGEITLVDHGQVVNYFGSNRFGQYLGETPAGMLGCLYVAPGHGDFSALTNRPYLDIRSMSGLQVDFFNHYIGGEIRLAYYHIGDQVLPVTGVSISGKLDQVLNEISLSSDLATYDGYTGPSRAVITGMQIF